MIFSRTAVFYIDVFLKYSQNDNKIRIIRVFFQKIAVCLYYDKNGTDFCCPYMSNYRAVDDSGARIR